MLPANNKGFLLIDSILACLMVCIICLLCFSLYKTINLYEEGFDNYQETSDELFVDIFHNLPVCQTCQINESD